MSSDLEITSRIVLHSVQLILLPACPIDENQ